MIAGGEGALLLVQVSSRSLMSIGSADFAIIRHRFTSVTARDADLAARCGAGTSAHASGMKADEIKFFSSMETVRGALIRPDISPLTA